MRLQKIGLNPTLLAGLMLLAIVLLVAIAAPLLTPYDPIAQNLAEAFKPPFSPTTSSAPTISAATCGAASPTARGWTSRLA